MNTWTTGWKISNALDRGSSHLHVEWAVGPKQATFSPHPMFEVVTLDVWRFRDTHTRSINSAALHDFFLFFTSTVFGPQAPERRRRHRNKPRNDRHEIAIREIMTSNKLLFFPEKQRRAVGNVSWDFVNSLKLVGGVQTEDALHRHRVIGCARDLRIKKVKLRPSWIVPKKSPNCVLKCALTCCF